MFKLNDLRDNTGARQCKKCLGRGIGSGKGKTSGRGGKGQTARSGVRLNGFEGGQTPLYRRLPKRGFTSLLGRHACELDFCKVNSIISRGLLRGDAVIDRDFLVSIGYIKNHVKEICLLANGSCNSQVNFVVSRASAKAVEMVERSGGSVVFE